MGLEKVEKIDDFRSILEEKDLFLLFKHSLTCPISKAAFAEFQSYLDHFLDMDAYFLAVQESRPLSNHIADYFDIQHESPQIFLIAKGKVVWHSSHWNITESAIKKAVEGIEKVS